jgi:hypothetical protein
MEKLRDPSHARDAAHGAEGPVSPAGLPAPRVSGYRLESDLESLLARSFPLPGDADKIRVIFAASLGDDRLGIPLVRDASASATPTPSPSWWPTRWQPRAVTVSSPLQP